MKRIAFSVLSIAVSAVVISPVQAIAAEPSNRIDQLRRENLDKNAAPLESLQIKGIGIDELRRENLDKEAIDIDKLRRENLEKNAISVGLKGIDIDELRRENLEKEVISQSAQ